VSDGSPTRALDEAIADFSGEPGVAGTIVTDWVVVVERCDGRGERVLQVGANSNMSSWKQSGMLQEALRMTHKGSQGGGW
jgi:hypothetical protein